MKSLKESLFDRDLATKSIDIIGYYFDICVCTEYVNINNSSIEEKMSKIIESKIFNTSVIGFNHNKLKDILLNVVKKDKIIYNYYVYDKKNHPIRNARFDKKLDMIDNIGEIVFNSYFEDDKNPIFVYITLTRKNI